MNKRITKLFCIILLLTSLNTTKPVPVISDTNSKIIVGTTSTLLVSIIGYKVYKYWKEKNKDNEDVTNSSILGKTLASIVLPIGISSSVILKYLFYDKFSESAHWNKVISSVSRISNKFKYTDNLKEKEKKYI